MVPAKLQKHLDERPRLHKGRLWMVSGGIMCLIGLDIDQVRINMMEWELTWANSSAERRDHLDRVLKL